MKEARNELLQFIAGLGMLGVGLLILSQRVTVSTAFFSGFRLGGYHVANGLIVFPFIVCIIWLFASGGSLGSKICTGLSVLAIVISIIASTEIHLDSMKLFDWILILILIFGGLGLLIKVIIIDANDDKDYGYSDRRNKRRKK